MRPRRWPDPGTHATFQSPTEHSVHCDFPAVRRGDLRLEMFQSPTEHSVHCDGREFERCGGKRNVSISYGAFGSLRPTANFGETAALTVSISYGAFGSLRLGRSGPPPPHDSGFNLLRSIRFIATFRTRRASFAARKCFNLLRSIRFIATVKVISSPRITRKFQSPTEHSVHCDIHRET